MKSKSKVLAAVGISGLLMAGGVISASASTSGYDLFKTAVKNTHNVNSFTANVQASLTDNGKVVYQVDSLNTEDLKNHAGSSTVKINNDGKKTNVAIYEKNHQTVVKNSKDNKYYVQQGNEGKFQQKYKTHKNETDSPQMQKDVEAIFDALTKNYQDKIASTDLGNGNTELTFDLTKDQIPAVGQAVVSFYLKNMDQQKQHIGKQEFGFLQFADLKPQLPQLKNNITVSEVVLKGEVDQKQYLIGQEATITVSGDDVNGTPHELVLHITSHLDNLNNSKVTTVNLKGKKVVKVKENHHGHED